MKKSWLMILIVIMTSLSATAQHPGEWTNNNDGKILYEGKYTLTGRFSVNGNVSQQYVNSSSFYVKIYSDKMIVTEIPFGEAVAKDTEYLLKNKDEDILIYQNKRDMVCYQVDKNYELMKVVTSPSMLYGNNLHDHYSYEIVKGEHYLEYNKRHGLDPETLYDLLYGNNPLGFEIDY